MFTSMSSNEAEDNNNMSMNEDSYSSQKTNLTFINIPTKHEETESICSDTASFSEETKIIGATNTTIVCEGTEGSFKGFKVLKLDLVCSRYKMPLNAALDENLVIKCDPFEKIYVKQENEDYDASLFSTYDDHNDSDSEKRIHTGEQQHHCDVCNKTFSRSGHLNRHKLTHTGEKPYHCDVCNKTFTQLTNFSRHKLIHTGEKPYKCEICDKTFTQASNFSRHKLTHSGEKPYKCDVCNKKFTQTSSLHKHKLLHTGEKPYKCDVCNVSFTQSSNLNSHKLTHTGEKPYKCDVCDKTFAHSNYFRIHKLIHKGEKPYQCDICDKNFTQSGHLHRHKRTMHSLQLYTIAQDTGLK